MSESGKLHELAEDQRMSAEYNERTAGTHGETIGGRVFFSNIRRSLEIEDEILLISVGVDIGSSTSHLVFSRLLLDQNASLHLCR